MGLGISKLDVNPPLHRMFFKIPRSAEMNWTAIHTTTNVNMQMTP
jgi:hypothetical protein